MELGFLGAGNMGEALARGALRAGIVKPHELTLFDVATDRMQEIAGALHASNAMNPLEVVHRCETVVFAVKPQNMPDLLDLLARDREVRRLLPKRLFVSICAGIQISTIQRGLLKIGAGETVPDVVPRVVRVMPNTPALIGAGAAAVARGAGVTPEQFESVMKLMRGVGLAVEVHEREIDAVTALSGSGPAYVFKLIEALQAAGVAEGLDADTARKLTLQTVFGAAKMALEQADTDTAELRQRVTSPGGTTAEGLAVLDAGNFDDLVRRCVAAAAARSRELGA